MKTLEEYTIIGEYKADEHAEIVNTSPKVAWLYTIDTEGHMNRKSVSLDE